MESFQLDFASILIQIDSIGARYAETDARNDGINDNLYSTSGNLDLKKKLFWERFEQQTNGAHHRIELVELH